MNEHKKHGSSFSSKMGFILAAAGSAVGLGNLWRFPYLAAKYGGGSFLLIYVILAVTFGFALMITEIALGRKTGKSALYAFSTLHEKCGFIGILASIVPIIILPYYCVIGGWVIKFAWAFLTGSGNAAAADDYFSNFIARTGEPVMWLVFFILATSVVILLGVNKGIENISSADAASGSPFRYYCGICCDPSGSRGRNCLLLKAGSFQDQCECFPGGTGTAVLFHVAGDGHYDYIWLLYEEK